MKTKYLLKELILSLFLVLAISSCTTKDDLITELVVDREFAPVDLTTKVRNQTFVELNWMVRDGVENYVVEFSADDPNFTIIFETLSVNAAELPITIGLEGETVYSIRVKAISSKGLEDSKWAIGEATTLTEQIMLPSEPGDIQALKATLRWTPNSKVTQLVLSPGDIVHNITAQEKIDGVATVTGLTSETDYSALLLNNTKTRGSAEFTTGIDVGDNTLVTVDDDLFQMIADAAPGDILLLEKGDYTSQIGKITLDKSITIQGLRTDFKPLLKVSFDIESGAAEVNLIDLDLTGDVATELTNVISYTGVGNYNSLLIRGCNIHDYNKSFIAGSVTDAIVQSVTVENCIVTNVLTDGGDFIDFRNSDALNINVNTSTFNNCAPGRDFIRMDAAGTSNGNSTSNIVIDSCTLYACSNSSSRRLFYVRFDANDVTSTNNLIAETASEGYADRSGIDETPTFNNNNYFNAPGFYNTSQYIYDDTNYTELDPGFEDAAAGNFKVSNQTLLDNQIGDPRWRQ